ncbi:MAG: TIM barrel protein [Pseudomonadota bacterium]
MQFSANLGFLWSDLALPEAIRAAKAAGFAAVEAHWPYDTPADAVSDALSETGLPMLGINTVRGQPGENGLAALPDRTEDARRAIDQALAYADAIDANAVHVMAGFSTGTDARAVFAENLRYACERTHRMILIEPLNRHDAPGYFLQTTDQAADVISCVDCENLRLMFDCYHVGRTEGDVITRLEALLPIIGHIQVASVPDRGAPDHGELHYPAIFAQLAALGWTTPLGAEFKPGNAKQIAAWIASLPQDMG